MVEPEPLAAEAGRNPSTGCFLQIIGRQQVVDPHLQRSFRFQGRKCFPLLKCFTSMDAGYAASQGIFLRGQDHLFAFF